MIARPEDLPRHDVIIIGGALAGASNAILLLREQPGLRVLIIEKSTAFTRRVGEATVELSAYFLGRVLGLTQYLNEAHLVKQGMRFWFANDQAASLERCSEIGARYLVRVPSYQLDRSTLDEEVLRRAQALGATVMRPATVQSVQLAPGETQIVTVRRGDETETVRGRWVIDASGVAALLSRKNGWFQSNTAHPTTAVWARWQGVKDWDGFELAKKFPGWSRACHGTRATATNHFVGPGWWAWCIPLKGGDVSVGVVFDQRQVAWAENGSPGQRLKEFLLRHPAAREILQDAKWQEGDVHWRKQLPYSSTRYAGDGFVIVGDAGAFLDPFYSPGMDWLSFSVSRSTDLILAQARGETLAPRIDAFNHDFATAYRRWFEAIYRDKYDYLGDYDLMRLAFLLDLGFYYLGIASQPFRRGQPALLTLPFTGWQATPFYHLLRAYNGRLAALGRSRRARGVFGRHNADRRFLFGGYTFSPTGYLPILKGLLGWLWLEMCEGWRSWGEKERVPAPAPAPATGATTGWVRAPACAAPGCSADAAGNTR